MKYHDWTPQQHIDEACRLLEKCSGVAQDRADVHYHGLIKAQIHADLAQAKLTAMVVDIR